MLLLLPTVRLVRGAETVAALGMAVLLRAELSPLLVTAEVDL